MNSQVLWIEHVELRRERDEARVEAASARQDISRLLKVNKELVYGMRRLANIATGRVTGAKRGRPAKVGR